MKKYKAGSIISIYYLLSNNVGIFYNTQLQKAVHYEAIISLPMRIVLKWIDEGILREAVKMDDDEAVKEHRATLARRKVYRDSLKEIDITKIYFLKI